MSPKTLTEAAFKMLDIRDRMKEAFCFLPNSKKVSVRVCNESEDPLTFQDAGDLNSSFIDASGSSDKDAEVTIVDYTVGVGELFKLNAVVCSTSVEGLCRIEKDGSKVGMIRLGAGRKDGRFDWTPSRDYEAGTNLKVIFAASSNSGKDVDIFVQGRLF